ncbi:F0F1 ATP synthase subunit A [Chitinophaga silvatica]|uniref:ATP synthase subunit a n=1 Tax=Chitinophaga silvatica TaxID=2282649 RepID=A0A3E1Y619_9BACT|nr:F0F1 ATP synthase subunit A [Chitinophaga silvatica]RFS20184.1 F0F1 ATP synthase subunit A [Chitinophaga silvatica]
MRLSPDEKIFWKDGFFQLNLTIVTTWMLMLVMVIAAYLVTRRLKNSITISRWQHILEIIVLTILTQMEDVGLKKPEKYLAFVGTLFLFIVVANLFSIVPMYESPTASLSTTSALAISVFIAVPVFGIAEKGILKYMKTYLQPNFLMLPFNIISEISRTLALAIRLFGNMMSGGMIVSILLIIAPYFFPIIMNVLGLLTGMVQAYIFAILATVYISAATQTEEQQLQKSQK